jgi:hypothetical protein
MIETAMTGGKISRPLSAIRSGLAVSVFLTANCLASAAFAVEAPEGEGAAAPNPPISQQSASQRGTTVGPIYTPPADADITGVWWTERYDPVVQIEGGGPIPYNEEGAAAYEEIKAGIADGSETDEARRVCVPDGLPRILSNPYPFQIIETPGQVTFVYELNHVIRPIKLDVPQVDADTLEIFPYYMGHSIGHWEGDTLVIESAGFNERTWLDSTGAPSSWQKTTTERVRKLEDGRLEIVIEVNDPLYLSGPFTARYTYNKHDDVRLQDYNCGDEHRDISHIPGVVRPQQ